MKNLCKMLTQKSRDLIEWKERLWSQIRRVGMAMMSVLPRLVNRFKAILVKIPGVLFKHGHVVSKMHLERQVKGPRIRAARAT